MKICLVFLTFVTMASQAALICKDVTADFFGVYYLAQTQIDPKVPLHVLKEMTLRSQENEKSYQRFLDRNFHSDPQRARENILEHISNEKFAIAPNGKLNSWLTPNRLFAAYQENLKKQVKVKTQVKWIPEIQGRGLFADQLIKKGSLIGEYTGIMRPLNLIRDRKNMYLMDTQFSTAQGREVIIDAQDSGNEMRFLNHSSFPVDHPKGINAHLMSLTLESRSIPFFIALRDILPGEQILISYGPEYWESVGYQPVGF